MVLKPVALGLAGGILVGGSVAFMTLWILIAGGGQHLQLIDKFYLGYSVSPLGVLLGLIYGFIDGFICGWLLAFLYNKLARA